MIESKLTEKEVLDSLKDREKSANELLKSLDNTKFLKPGQWSLRLR